MAARVTSVDRESPAARAGVRPGDELLQIDGQEIRDVFDYKFYGYDPAVTLLIKREGRPLSLRVEKAEGEPLGLEFETYLMDKPRACRNRCVFCFIDQMPPGMRKSLYFKDDDARLSFLQGNYITLTNLSDADVRRIVDMHISPVNVSVQTTDPALRAMMLGNPAAGEALRHLETLAGGGIRINAQIVVCPGLNDGEALRRTLRDLEALRPALLSCSVVPVGITRYREKLYPLKTFDSSDAESLLDLVEPIGDRCLRRHGSRLFYCADEIFLLAGRPLPGAAYYEDFPQLENGVGMAALFLEEADGTLAELGEIPPPRSFTLATGILFSPILQKLIDRILLKCNNSVWGEVVPIPNRFFGETVTVAGLVTGGDLIARLRGRRLGERLLIPGSMLRAGEPVFLDDVTVRDVEDALEVPVTVSPQDGGEFVKTLLEVR